jgi:hypothetical protein
VGPVRAPLATPSSQLWAKTETTLPCLSSLDTQLEAIHVNLCLLLSLEQTDSLGTLAVEN